MGKVMDVFKAILTRLIFAGHGFVAIWRVTTIKWDPSTEPDPNFWYLSISLLVLAFEGIFTLTIKANQEWRWFCPSVFLYLSSVVPSIWLLEIDKNRRRKMQMMVMKEEFNLTDFNSTLSSTFNSSFNGVFGNSINGTEDLQAIQTIVGGLEIKIPPETWNTVIEQFLMLILIIGRWLLPKGDLTREQLSQLLLVYIGTAADIIEFFDSFKDKTVAESETLFYVTLSIWSWSLLQFTLVFTKKTKKKKKKKKDAGDKCCRHKCMKVCCSVDVWSILINIILQDAPFFTFRLLLIFYYNVISYMNIFFTCKNTLVIILQFYRLIVVQAEKRKGLRNPQQSRGKIAFDGSGKRAAAESSRSSGRSGISGIANAKVAASRKCKPVGGRRAVGKLVRTDDGTGIYPSDRGQHSTFLLHTENDPSWKQYSRGRRRSLSTGDLSVTAEMSVDIESSADDSPCFSGDMAAGEGESDLEADVLSNLEEENNDDDSQGLDDDLEEAAAFNNDRKIRMNSRYGTVDEVRPSSRSSAGPSRPVPLPRRQGSSSGNLASERSRSSNQLGAREKKDRRLTSRQDTGYSTASSVSTRESPGNGKREMGNNRSPNRDGRERESRRGAAARPQELRGLHSGSRNLQDQFDDAYEASSPLRSNRSGSKGNQQRSSRKSGGS